MLDGIDPNRSRILLSEQVQSGRESEIVMEAYVRSKPDDDRALEVRHIRGSVQRLNAPELIVVNEDAQALSYDLDLLYALAFGEAASEEIQEGLQYHEQLLKVFPAYDCDEATLLNSVP